MAGQHLHHQAVFRDHDVSAASMRLRRNHMRRRRGKSVPFNFNLWVRAKYEKITTSMFFSPAIAVLIAVIAGLGLVVLDRYLTENGMEPPVVLTTTVESARALLSTVAGATISFAGTAFSVSLLVLQLGSSQYSPRILHTLFKDPFNRAIVAFVVGTFTYCLVVMRSVDSNPPVGEPDEPPIVPNISVSVAVILGILSVLFIVAFIDHSANTMDISQLLERITRDTIAQMKNTWKDDDPDNQPEDNTYNGNEDTIVKTLTDLEGDTIRELQQVLELDSGGEEDDAHSCNEENEDNPKKPKYNKGEATRAEGLNKCHVVRFSTSGWVQEIDLEGLLRLVPPNGYMKLHTLAGRYAIPGSPICSVYPKPTRSNTKGDSLDITKKDGYNSHGTTDNEEEEDEQDFLLDFDDRVLDSVMIGLNRTTRSDPTYGLRQLADVVLRALSPGVNDPTTAQDGIFHIAAVVIEFLQRVPPPSVMEHKETKGKLIVNEQPDYDNIVRLGFDEARVCATSSPTVAVYLLEALRLIRDSLVASGRPRRAPEIERQARLIEEGILAANHLREDKEDISLARRNRFAHNYGSAARTNDELLAA